MTFDEAVRELERWSQPADVTREEADELIVDALVAGHQRAIDASRRRGLLHAVEFLRTAVQPCSLPVVDAAALTDGFWDLDTWIPTPTHVLQSERAT